jgi:mono/diheme cytochrome c family protein
MIIRLGVLLFAAASLASVHASAADWQSVRPVMEKYCIECHGGKRTRGGVDLKQVLDDPQVAGNFELWEKVSHAMESGDMPPEDDPQLAPAEKELITKWLEGSLQAAAKENAGDPGHVTVRRLTNAEYDNTIRALTGIDYGLAKDFLPDGGGGEGFSNVGDVLFVSPQQIDKYLAAARKLTEHAAILPGRGIMFQETRVGLRGPLQLKDQAESSLYIWYQKMAEPYIPKDGEDMREGDYMTACWKFKHREMTGAQSLEQLAKEGDLSAAFLANWWEMLNSDKVKSRFLDLTRVAWRELPGPDEVNPKAVPAAVASKISAIQDQRRSWTNLDPAKGWTRSQRRQQDSDGLRAYEMTTPILKGQPVHLVAGDTGDGSRGDMVIIEKITIKRNGKFENYVTWLKRRIEGNTALIKTLNEAPKPDTVRIAGLEKAVEEGQKALALFGKHPLGRPLEPTMLVLQAPVVVTLPFGEEASVSVKGRLEMSGPEVDFATVQFTAAGANPPDPTKIIPGALVLWKRQTEIARSTMGDFGRMKMVFPDEYARRLEQVARNYRFKDGKNEGVYYFSDAQLNSFISVQEQDRMRRMLKDWRLLSPRNPDSKIQKEWDQSVQGHLHHFASRAWRRPLSTEEKTGLNAIYDEARSRELDRESAAREVLMRVFVSPDFIFRLEKSDQPGVHPVDAWELASRLSYFLWSSSPDEALRKAAADGSLLKPEVLEAQTKRMLAGKNSASLAEEFAGQWLKFHNFSKHSTVDAGKFPEFTPELRADMHRETKEFFSHLIRNDRPVKEIILADYTFLNERLAKHYGIPGVTGSEFRKVSVSSHHRGGILGMGSVLVKTSFPQRTSPVLRGDWLLHAVLGMPTPPAPADVPPFPEHSDKPMTVREKLEAHRADKACASCHDKIDPLGFALEGFDALGRFRDKDENGLAIDDIGSLKDGTTMEGIEGLRSYLAKHDREFNQVLARKLIGYSLGRSVLASDKVLIEEISSLLKSSDGKFSTAVLAIVKSPQFLNRRND